MWSSKKYKRAAEKHYKTCLHILNTFDIVKVDAKPQLICNVFYISGYILECIMKFYILETEHKGQNYSFSEIELKNIGIWHHDLKKLWVRVQDKGINAKQISWTDLSLKWDVYVRYETDIEDYKSEEFVRKHFSQTVQPIYNKLKNKY